VVTASTVQWHWEPTPKEDGHGRKWKKNKEYMEKDDAKWERLESDRQTTEETKHYSWRE
jgi:hypothetical protein